MQNEKLQQKINRLSNENTNLNDQVRTAQENLRLSANQQQKLAKELSDYKNQITTNNEISETYKLKIQKLTSENTNLGEEVRNVQ